MKTQRIAQSLISALIVGITFTFCGCKEPTETIPTSGGQTSGTTDEGTTDDTSAIVDVAGATKSLPELKIELIDFEGLQSVVKEHSGKIVVVDVWSNSCLPCMKEFHNLVELSQRHPDQVVCVSMNVNYIGLKSKPPESSLPKVREFLESENASSVINFISSEADSDVLSKYEVDSMPAVIVYDPSGKIVAKFTDSTSGEGGMSYEASVLPKVDEMLAELAAAE